MSYKYKGKKDKKGKKGRKDKLRDIDDDITAQVSFVLNFENTKNSPENINIWELRIWEFFVQI